MLTKHHDSSGTPNAALHLHDDHLAFGHRFNDLCERAATGDWHELDEVWTGFMTDIERHLGFEEQQIFPRYSEGSPDRSAVARRLLDQHAEMRRMLDSIGLQIQLKEVRAATIEAFTALMREHASVEDTSVYPWAVLADV